MKYAPQALKNLFMKPATKKYPLEKPVYPDGSRGHVTISIDECISCGMCARACPNGALKVDRNAGTWTIDRFDCIACGYCVLKCPKKCLFMEKGYQTPGPEKKEETFTKSPEVLAAEEEKRKEAARKAAEAKAAMAAKAAGESKPAEEKKD